MEVQETIMKWEVNDDARSVLTPFAIAVAMAASLLGKDYFDRTAKSSAAEKDVSVEDFLFSAARDVAPAVSSGVMNF